MPHRKGYKPTEYFGPTKRYYKVWGRQSAGKFVRYEELLYVKVCPGCQLALPFEMYHKCSNRYCGIHHYCKECRKEKAKSWRCFYTWGLKKRAFAKADDALQALGKCLRPGR